MKKKVLIVLVLLIIAIILLIFFGIGSKRTDVYLEDFSVESNWDVMKIKVGISSSSGYVRTMKMKTEGTNIYITFYSTVGINNKINSKNEFEFDISVICDKIYFYNGDGSYTKVLEKDKETNNWKIPSSESELKDIISDVQLIEISVLDENNPEGLIYKENHKITDKGLILEITSKINDCEEYLEFEDDFGAGGFFEGCPIIESYENNGSKKMITVCDDFAQNENGDFFNFMMVWKNEDGSDKKIYKANQNLEAYIKELYAKYEQEVKNYDKNLKMAYSTENQKFEYLSEMNKSDYDWQDYIVENKAILKDMSEVDFSQFQELGEDFYSLQIADYETYQKYAQNYNLKPLEKSDFKNLFVQIIIRKSADYSITSGELIKGLENMESEESYTFPVRTGGLFDVTEEFQYPCLIGYFPNYMNEHYSNFYFKVMVQNETIKISREKALEIAKKYLKDLDYKGCTNFTNIDFVRITKEYENNFVKTEDKENPINTENERCVWSISGYSEQDPCTSANIYIDVENGKIVGGIIHYATD